MIGTWPASPALRLSDDDAQVEPLCALIGDLHEALREALPPVQIQRIIRDIESLAERQFTAEEKAMARCRYPWADDHRRQHESFRRRLRVLRVHLTVGTYMPLMADMVEDGFVDWWECHVTGPDHRLAAHMRALARKN